MRRHNLATVLTLLHREGPRSRADLTHTTGLNRSTVGDLVGDLLDAGLVIERAPYDTGERGRPSPVIAPHPRVGAIVVNPESDALTIGIVGFGGVVHRRMRRPSDRAMTVEEVVDHTIDTLAKLAPEIEERYSVLGMGVAVPGLVRPGTGDIVRAPHLGWADAPVTQLLADATGYRVVASRDASVALVAESAFGAARGVENLVYLTSGHSGVSGAILADGRPLGGHGGFGPELGHTVVVGGTRECYCGRRGCLEAELDLRELAHALGLPEPSIAAIVTALDLDVSRESDVLLRQVDFLADALTVFVGVFNPEIIMLGGLLGAMYDALPQRVDDAIRVSSISPLTELLRVRRAALGSDAVLIGGAETVFDAVLEDPMSALAR